MVCRACSALPLAISTHRQNVQHHPTYEELNKSAQSGCQICALLRTILLEYYAHGLSRSVEEAEHYHQQLDQQHMSSDNDEHSDSEESTRRGQHTRSVFFLEAVLSTSSNSEPQLQGVRGLLYLRVDAGSPDPIDEIYPFVEVSSLPGTYIQPKLSNFMSDSTKTALLCANGISSGNR